MLNAIYAEFLKLRRTYIIPLVTIFSIPFLNILQQVNSGKIIHLDESFSIIEATNTLTIDVLIFAIVTGYIFTREYTDHTASTAYSYPVGKKGIFLSKFILSIILIVYVFLLQFFSTLLIGLMVPHEALTKQVLLKHLFVYIYSMLFFIALQPITILVSQILKNILFVFVYSILWIIVNVLSLNTTQLAASIIPHSLPVLPAVIVTRKAISTVFFMPCSSIISGILTFIIGMAACLIYFKKSNIC